MLIYLREPKIARNILVLLLTFQDVRNVKKVLVFMKKPVTVPIIPCVQKKRPILRNVLHAKEATTSTLMTECATKPPKTRSVPNYSWTTQAEQTASSASLVKTKAKSPFIMTSESLASRTISSVFLTFTISRLPCSLSLFSKNLIGEMNKTSSTSLMKMETNFLFLLHQMMSMAKTISACLDSESSFSVTLSTKQLKNVPSATMATICTTASATKVKFPYALNM